MKLRIRGNTLRLRLTRGEVADIELGQAIRETAQLPDGSSFSYQLSCGEDHAVSQIHEGSNTLIDITIQTQRASAWATSDEVGYAGNDPFSVGPTQVLIEKDFTCITPREGEEELDTYPNPNAASA